MAKPPKIPRPQKPPVRDPRPDQVLNPQISITQEKLIGRVVASWSAVEAAMEDFIWFLLKVELPKGRIITTRLDALARINMLRSLGELELSEPTFHRLSQMLDRLDIVREERNFIVHGLWGTSLPENVPIALSLRPKWKSDQVVSETFPRERMQAIHSEIENGRKRLLRLMIELGALPQTPPPPRPEG
jgi:hypothetical protein